MYCPKIDVHHHILPPFYVDALGAQFLGAQGSSGRLPQWSIDGSLSLMDQAGIDTAITSVSAPGVQPLAEMAANALNRRCNEFAAEMVRDYPSRFGFFAALPLQSVDAALREVEYAFDVLGADGVCLLSNYNGVYLGDERFHPLYEELNRRSAVVFMHPTSPLHRVDLPGLSPSMVEFPFDTTRTIASLIFQGVTQRFGAIRWIFSHAGGAIPYLAGRFEVLAGNNPVLREVLPQGFSSALQGLYFDCALSANAVHFATLRTLLPDSQLLFGTDYPFGPANQMSSTVTEIENLELPESVQHSIFSGNALNLFPRLGDGKLELKKRVQYFQNAGQR